MADPASNLPPLRVCFIAPEMAPLVKVGGLADVVGALPAALAEVGVEAVVLLPGFEELFEAAQRLGIEVRPIAGVPPFRRNGETATFDRLVLGERSTRPLVDAQASSSRRAGESTAPPAPIDVLIVGNPRFFAHRRGVYQDESAGRANPQPFPDDLARWVYFQNAALHLLAELAARGRRFDVIHTHDHATALVPAYCRVGRYAGVLSQTPQVFTIHNVGYQGLYPPGPLPGGGGGEMSPNAFALATGFGANLFQPASPFEFYGQLNCLKAAIEFADLVTVVSPTYAREIQASAEYGHGLQGVLAAHSNKLVGILNGIDDSYWNPARDPYLPQRFSADDPSGKAACKRALCERLALSPAMLDAPCLGIVSRFVWQKGIDAVVEVTDELMASRRCTLAVLGSGDRDLMTAMRALSTRHPGRVAFESGYDEPLAHLIEAGADAFLMPSRYEPCGLNQMYSLAYGTLPIVRETGGLADTVTDLTIDPDSGNGFSFGPFTPAALLDAITRAIDLYTQQPARWREAMRRAMRIDHSWTVAAGQYADLYRRLVNTQPGAV